MFDLPLGLSRTQGIRQSLWTPPKSNNLLHIIRRRTNTIPDHLSKAPFFSMSDYDAVKLFGVAFGPELDQLKNASSTAESKSESHSTRTLGMLGPDELSPSQLLFGDDYTEVNRTLVGILALKWIISNDYAAFTQCQIPAVKLRPESFRQLRELFLVDLRTDEVVYTLIVAILINDLGKDPSLSLAVSQIPGQDKVQLNHDEVINLASSNNLLALLREFPRNSPSWDILKGGLRIGAKLNIAQLAQAENVPGNLKDVFDTPEACKAFPLKFMELVLDVAGAGGHDDARCAKAWIEPVNQTFMTAKRAWTDLIANQRSVRFAYDQILLQRAQLLYHSGFSQLSVSNPFERALLRLMTMGRITSAPQATQFQLAFDRLPADSTRCALSNGLNVDGTDDGLAVLPYYMPAMFAHAVKYTKKSSPQIQIDAISALMRLLTRVYRGTQPRPGCGWGRIVECDVSFARTVIETDEFSERPDVLDSLEIPDSAYSVGEEGWEGLVGRLEIGSNR